MPQMYCPTCAKWSDINDSHRAPGPTCKKCKSRLG